MDDIQFSNPLLDFEWEVKKNGYWCAVGSPTRQNHPDVHRAILSSSTQQGSYLVSVEGTTDRYSPLKDTTGLFKIFAATDPTEKGIVEFANRYGHLGEGIEIWTFRTGQEPQRFIGEPLAFWSLQINLMRAALDLWQKAKAGDTKKLDRIIKWVGDDVTFHNSKHAPYNQFMNQFLTDQYPVLPVQFSPGDLIGPALGFVEMIVMRQVRQFGVSPRIGLDPERLKFNFQFWPHSLLSAIWLQSVLAIVGEKDFERCAWCETPFEVSTGPHGARTNRLYCSDACKMRAYRARNSKAKKRRKSSYVKKTKKA